MNASSIRRWGAAPAAAILAALLMGPLAATAQIQVLISGGFSGPYEQLLPEFQRTTGLKVSTGSGASQGTGPQTIAAQLARGVPADVVILSREGLAELMAAQRIAAGTDVDLARTPLGVAVRAGAPKPDVSTVEAFRQVALGARAIAVPGSTSGIFLAKEVFPRLGIADKVNLKATPRGTGAAAMVAAGEADIAVMPVSEIVHAPGIELVGVLAQEIQLNQVFAAAVTASATQREAAQRLIAFLASERAAAAIRSGGMEPLGPRRP
jgi:molybdate transport system substrate-binding protein